MAGTSVVTVLVCDLVESTALMVRVGDDTADAMRREMFATWRAAIEQEGGVVVKTIGDAVMAVFPLSSVQAICASTTMQAAADDYAIRIGIAHGEAAEDHGDWFGTPVVEAFRLCARCQPRETLVTAVARRVVGTRGDFEFESVGALSLKGLPEPVPTFALTHASAPRVRRERPRRRWLAMVAMIAVLALIGGAIAVAARGDSTKSGTSVNARDLGYTPKLEPRKCVGNEQGNDSRITCSTLVVPEDRTKPNGRQVRVRVIYAPALNRQGLPEVYVGPEGARPAVTDLRAVADTYFITPRGSASSRPDLSCAPTRDSLRARLGRPYRQSISDLYTALDACRAQLVSAGVDLTRYGPDDVADDIRDLAIAAQLEKFDARAYGEYTFAIYSLLRRSPSMVRAVVTASPVAPSDDPFDQSGVADLAWRDYVKHCAASAQCRRIAGDLDGDLTRAVSQFASHPQLIRVTAPDQTEVGVLVDGDRAIEALWEGLHEDVAYPLLAAVVHRRNAQASATYIALRYLSSIEPVDPDVRAIVWQCKRSGADAPAGLAASKAILPRWRVLIATEGLARCTKWHIPPELELRATPSFNAPTLVLLADREPQASAMRALGATLSHSRVLALRGHAWTDTSAWPACVITLRRAFVRDPTANLDPDACGKSATPLEYQDIAAAAVAP